MDIANPDLAAGGPAETGMGDIGKRAFVHQLLDEAGHPEIVTWKVVSVLKELSLGRHAGRTAINQLSHGIPFLSHQSRQKPPGCGWS